MTSHVTHTKLCGKPKVGTSNPRFGSRKSEVESRTSEVAPWLSYQRSSSLPPTRDRHTFIPQFWPRIARNQSTLIHIVFLLRYSSRFLTIEIKSKKIKMVMVSLGKKWLPMLLISISRSKLCGKPKVWASNSPFGIRQSEVKSRTSEAPP